MGGDWLADFDQALSGLRDLAKALSTYYNELREQGFDEEQAIRIVIEWQSAMLAPRSED